MSEKKQYQRAEVPEALKWKLTDLYASDEQWEAQVAEIDRMSETIAQYRGKLGESASTLTEFFQKQDTLLNKLSRVYVYANQSYHQDTADTLYLFI